VAHLVQTSALVVVGDDLDRSFRSIGHVDTRRYSDGAKAKVSQASYHDGGMRLDAKSAAWAVANGHVDGYIGLRVAQIDLDRAPGDREVGAVGLNFVEAAAWEDAFLVIVEATRRGIGELEVCEGEREEGEGEQCLGKHVAGWWVNGWVNGWMDGLTRSGVEWSRRSSYRIYSFHPSNFAWRTRQATRIGWSSPQGTEAHHKHGEMSKIVRHLLA